jgi:hypothetical protein
MTTTPSSPTAPIPSSGWYGTPNLLGVQVTALDEVAVSRMGGVDHWLRRDRQPAAVISAHSGAQARARPPAGVARG